MSGPSDKSDRQNLSTAQELLDQARALQRQLKSKGDSQPSVAQSPPPPRPDSSVTELTAKVEDAVEAIQSVNQNLSSVRGWLYTLRETLAGINEHVLWPITSVLGPPLRWLIAKYRLIWQRFAYVTNETTQERVFSRKRSSILVVATFLILSIFTPTALGNAVRFVTVEPLSDGALILFSKRTEEFFLNNSEEVDPEGNEHAVRGCRISGQCTERDAVYFRVKPRIAHDLWKLWTHGNPIYVPDHVIAPIAPGVNRCEVTYYGYRLTSSWTSRLLRSLEVYPVMLEASCTAVTSDLLGRQN